MKSLWELYSYHMLKQHITPSDLPDNLFFTFCGDILGSSGEHYEKGKPISLEVAASKTNAHYSDDFSESLAMYQLVGKRWKTDLQSLIVGRDEFLNLIRQHYIAYGLQYSPWAAALFEETKVERYGVLIAHHKGCGAAMRAAALAPHSLSSDEVFPFFLITHAHPEAITGAYMVWGYARALLERKTFDVAYSEACEYAIQGRDMVLSFLDKNNLPVDERICPVEATKKVIETGDPYAMISDIKEEGIDTAFVVSSSFLILHEVNGKTVEDGVRYVVERGLEIGGDPDTICSITMSLYGLQHAREAKDVLCSIMVRGDV
ncbi:MAG: ADP-ribosylglycohydrolase family protein [Alphaproteobacteria bacterium]|nr:ADP-ribosylglycohydrolase family protein [Alphaproteobacteria bacterium]